MDFKSTNMNEILRDTQLSYAPCYLAYTRVNVYHSVLVDTRWQRSVHTCDTCAFQAPICQESGGPTTDGAPFLCRAVHFAQCNPVRKPPLGVVIPKSPKTRAQNPRNVQNPQNIQNPKNIQITLRNHNVQITRNAQNPQITKTTQNIQNPEIFPNSPNFQNPHKNVQNPEIVQNPEFSPKSHERSVRIVPIASVPTEGVSSLGISGARGNFVGRRVGKRVVTRRHLLLQLELNQVCVREFGVFYTVIS